MYKYENNRMKIDNYVYDFKFEIRNVIQYNNNYIILLSIPFNNSEINNLYCLNSKAELLWQAQDLKSLFPDLKNLLPYEQMGIKEDYI